MFSSRLDHLANKYWWLILLLFCIPAVWALFIPGYFGASDDLHIAWLQQMDKVIKIGQIPPRYVPDLSYGFGYPLFNFVFPLPFYIGEFFHLIGFSFVDSVKAVFLVSVIFSSLTMYLFLKQISQNKLLGMAGAILYTFTPYRSVDLYVRGAIGEVTSFVFLPLVVLSIIKLTPFETKDKLNYRWIGIGSLALAALVLSHNITAYMFLFFTFLLLILRLIFLKQNLAKNLWQIFLMFLISFLSSIYFWLPAIAESGLMQYSTVFNFADHFPTLMQLVTPYWGYGASVPGPGDGMSFFLGESNIALILISLFFILFFWRKFTKEEHVILIWAILSLFTAIFIMNYRSSFIWNNIPLLPYFQFPWRFLIITTFITPVFLLSLKKFKFVNYAVFILMICTLFTTAGYFRPQDFLGRRDDYYLTRYIPYPTASREYKLTQEEYLRLPKNTSVRPDQIYPRFYPDVSTLQIQEINSLDAKASVSFPIQGIINYNKYFFPGWYAKIDDQETKITPGVPFGQVSLQVPAGSHIIKVGFKETSLKFVLDLISLLSILLSFVFIFKNFKFPKDVLSLKR